MKRMILLIVSLGMSLANAHAARMYPAEGRVVNEQGQAVEYATVVVLRGTQQVAGMATDDEGRFELKVPPGDYTLSVQYLGYEPLRRQIRISENEKLGDLVLKNASTQIEGVVVEAQLIRREADRFVVQVANSPAAIGKDGMELLERAPGVWIDNDKISINGKSGSKVYLNDRELRLEPAQLLAYLRSLRAEEIQKIEVVPVTGADYDADSSGGVILITLKKRRENGLDGSLSLFTKQGPITHELSPGGNINVHSGKLDFYASAWGYVSKNNFITREQTTYDASDARLTARSEARFRDRNFGGRTGAVYALDDRHSIGAEFEFWRDNEKGPTRSATDFTLSEGVTRSDSRYLKHDVGHNYTATFNYIWKIDTLGSTFKVLADYTRRDADGSNDNSTRIAPPAPATVRDSLYRDASAARYDIATATLAFDKKFTPRWSLRTGVKYTRNDMHNEALYKYRRQDAWVSNEPLNFRIDYTENIAAAYGIASGKAGRWSLVAGLRAEYTSTRGKVRDMGQNYLSFFPNANVSYALTKDGAYSLIAQYARTIERPRFWSLNPQRQQISDYTYQTGNPSLNPAFRDDVSVTLVLKHKYTFTGGVTIQRDEIQQTMRADADNPDHLCLTWVNFDTTHGYYAAVNLPFQLTKWWQLNLGANYIRRGQRVEQHAREEYFNFLFVNAATTFSLPAKFYIDLSYNYRSKLVMGNCWITPEHRLQAGIKKRFGERFTATFSVTNLLDQGMTVGARGEGFVREVKARQTGSNRAFNLGVIWNFKSGKAFQRKAVEAGSDDEKRRL